MEWRAYRKGDQANSRTFCHLSIILVLQFLLKFAQGQGPGNDYQHFTIHENSQIGTEVGQIRTRENYVYSFSSDSKGNDYFNLGSNTGLITTKVEIDRESLQLPENQFNILILGKSSSATYPVEIAIEVLDVNDNKPTFPEELVTVNFRENSQIGSNQYISTATDSDAGQNAKISHYDIISGQGPFKFVFNPVLYGDVLIIETVGDLDRENVSQYEFVVSARDDGTPQLSGTCTVRITITDENDHPPIFDPSEYQAKVNETDPAGTHVIQVVASDRDSGKNKEISYYIVDKNQESDQFSINENTGEIYTTKEPLRCTGGKCLLNVAAHDHGVPQYTGRAFVHISIVDTNNHDPVITFKYVPDGNTEFSSVNEDASNGEIVAGIYTSDQDTGVYGQTTAKIIAGNELKHFVFQNFAQGIYSVHVNGDGVLDRERQDIYNLTIQAKDQGNPPRTSIKYLIIYVNDINDHAPVFVNKRVSLSISETTKVSSFIASMLAMDGDTGNNAKLTYTFLSGNNPEWFHINPDSGLVTTIAKLHYREKNRFRFNISVHDGALRPLYDYAELEISIVDENDITPTFTRSNYPASLEENLPGGAPVTTVSAADNDSGENGTVTYIFHSHVEVQYPSTFYLDSQTGSITTMKALDREQVARYELKVIAKDNGPVPLSSTATVDLDITDVNDNSPVFYPRKYFAKVIEGQGPNVIVIQVTAKDPDEGDNGKILYSFSGSNYNKFSIDADTGAIQTTKLLRKVDQASYTLTVVASDLLGQKSDEAAVVITVMSASDQSAHFNSDLYKFKIPEDPGEKPAVYVGASIGQVAASLPGSSVSEYAIVDGDKNNQFNLNSYSGSIQRAKAIDREETPLFLLKIVARFGSTYAETVVTIEVQDDNDNPPQFDFPVIKIDLIENWPVGHYIQIISATDADEEGPNSRIVYSLQRDQNNMFGIQSDSGLLYLKKPVQVLKESSTTLLVVAMDSGAVPNTASQEIRLTVKDVNNHTPKFGRTTYEKSLIESHAVNSRFFSVVAHDDDLGRNGELVYNITRGNEDRKFGIFPDGHLFIAKQLDRETKDLYNLSVIATDMGDVPRSSECNITIHITDDNDNKPIFLNGTYGFGVLENKPPGTLVGMVKAADADMGRNAEISYFLDTEGAKNFKIDRQTGEISTLRNFDREAYIATDFAITFDVIAKDNGLDSLQDVATVRVTILDENDNVPVFRKPVYHLTVFENAPPMVNITVVKADDADSDINSMVTYVIASGNEDHMFMIGQTTGQISIHKPLDRETLDNYELTILATDSGANVRNNASTVVKIKVADINDNFPLFAQSHLDISVAEDLEPGTMVGHFPATDLDLGVNGEISYSMSGQDDDNTFGIDVHTGKIYLQKALDYEVKRIYRLNVTATDNGVPPLPYYIRFSISIEDVNDNAPEFDGGPYTFHVTEHSSGSVSAVTARDKDSDKNGEVQYSIAHQDPTSGYFKIVRNTGQIYIDRQIDREEIDRFTLTVVATDQADNESERLSTETRVTILIDDINDNKPLVTSFNAIAVPRQTPQNEQLTTIEVSDKDVNENGRHSLTLIQNDADRFSLDSNTGRFYLKNVLQSLPLKYTMTVKTSDYGSPNRLSSETGITVIVTDNSDGPVFQNMPYKGSISETDSADTSILTVIASSPRGASVEYYVTNVTLKSSGAQVGRYFAVGKSSGTLTNTAMLDREEVGGEFDVEIYAVEAGSGITSPKTSLAKATVQLRDVNDSPPRFSKNFYTVDIDEDVRPDFIITKVTVYDDDSLGGLQLDLNVTSDVKLKINRDGTIVSTGPLDREKVSQYNLQVRASDGTQSSHCWVRINLLDKNDNEPQFTQAFYTFDVDEDTLIGTTIGSVRAHDPDEGLNGRVRYSLVSAWANKTFLLDPIKGTFRLEHVLDFEESQLYTLSVRASDLGDPALSSTVLVYFNVKDTNDNAPLFEHGMYDTAIFENVAMGTSVIQVNATDIDSGENGEVRYSITDGNMAGHFGIGVINGTVYTIAPLDRETIPTYLLNVTATDLAKKPEDRRSTSIQVSVSLTDINDYTPEFVSPAQIMVQENRPNGTVVHQVLVRDLDEGRNQQVEFSITSKSGGAPFTLGITDGKLRVNTNLDRETVQNYTMIITVRDKGNPSLSATQNLVIKIEDVNDHRPVFSPEFYDATVKEDVKIGTVLLRSVSATDEDAGLNGIVRYFIIGGDDNNDFSIDQSSGVIRTQKYLDFERTSTYSLIVQAEDSGDDMLYATATVSISVEDVNDCEPLFMDSPYVGYVHENMEVLPVHVLQVSAQDDDSAPFNQLRYEIRDGNHNLFNMSATTGEIMALQKLDREEVSQYTLTIIAKDSIVGRGNTGTGTVTIYVEDVNDNTPVFEHSGPYIAHVPENAELNTEVIIVKATDQDEGVNAQIIYSLSNSMEGIFTIFPDSGRISTMATLDRETTPHYELEVVARDASLLPLSSTATVIVYLDDVNDNVPVFDKTSYSRTVMAPAGSGMFILGATAKDADIGENGLIEYQLSQSGSQPFSIDPKTGVITATQSLSQGTTYNFYIVASDKGSPVQSSSVSVTVTVSSSSGVSPPTFSQVPPRLNIMENLALKSNVTTVTAQSSSGAAITYAIAGGNTGQAFGIDSQTGRIFVDGVVDYEITHQFRLWIEARNTGSNPVSNFAEVVIGVEDENDNTPRFSETLYNVTVMENTRSMQVITMVTATDADSGNNGKVAYTLDGTNSDKFVMDPTSGEILTLADLDREKEDTYSLTVIATDSGTSPRSSTSSVRIQLLDENDQPPAFTRLFNVKIPENLEVGSFVLRVTSSDNDIGNNAIATYSLIDDGQGMFRIDGVSGNITLNKPLDAEKESGYNLRVQATDSAHKVDGNVDIEVTDVNDEAPVIIPPTSFDFPEKSAIGSFVGQLKATDADISKPNNRILFSLKLASDFFDLDSETGAITSLDELTYYMMPESFPQINRYELVVIAKDLGTPVKSTEMTIHINVVDYNDHPPQFEQTEYRSAVPERTDIGTSILQVSAKDEADHGRNALVEYELAGGIGQPFFNVDRYLGMVSVKSSLSGHRNQDLMIQVRAIDKGIPQQSSTVNVHLIITSDNTYPPQFEAPKHRQISVNESQPVGSLIETFVANDIDNGMNGEVEFEITAGNEYELFVMDEDSGELSISQALDYEVAHEYRLRITAQDRGLYSKSATISFTVKLVDMNDNDPVFANAADAVYVEENTPAGVSVYQAIATDADSGDNKKIEYAIMEDIQAQNKFHINPTTGVVTTKGSLDYETKDTYKMTIMALNLDGKHKSTMVLTINIDGVNEDIPRFVKKVYYFSISESAEEKTSVGSVSATDNDEGEDGIVHYFLIGDSNDKGFKIDPRSGVIFVSGRPDYESSPNIKLQVLAKNFGSIQGNDTDTCTVHISVQDANDPPQFTQLTYQANIRENIEGAGVSIITVTAEDNDFEMTDRQFSYSILSTNLTHLFQINPSTGFVSTTGQGKFDREATPVYNLVVGAIDRGTPPETGSAVVQIFVEDVNDNGPEFVNFTATVAEGPGAPLVVTNLLQYTTDPDGNGNQGPFTFHEVPGPIREYEYFSIGQNSGEVRRLRELDRESIAEFIVPVIVKDAGTPQMTSTLSFRVSVMDINDKPPTQRFLTVFVSLYDGRIPSGTVADVRPNDEDLPESGTFKCSLSNLTSPFAIRPNSCHLYFREYPTTNSYTISVNGDDGKFSPVTYDVYIKIAAFNNNTLDHTTLIQVADTYTGHFMNNSYTKFVTSVRKAFEPQDEVFVYGLMQQSSGDLLIALAVKQATRDQYYSPDVLKQKLNAAKGQIQSDASIFILDVAFSTCTSSFCKNGGQCLSQVQVQSTTEIAESSYQSFFNPSLSLDHYCSCPPQYTGPRCDQQATPCGANIYCQNGGICVNSGSGKTCQCPSTWTGISCNVDVNECDDNLCENEATCENFKGGFTCRCRDGFYGEYCQSGADNCSPSPCGPGTCRNTLDGYQCSCPYGLWGDHCQYTSRGFSIGSYMEIPRLAQLTNSIEVTFATQQTNALLLYNPSSVANSAAFLALEIINGRIRFSVALGRLDERRIIVDKPVNTGEWFKVKAIRDRQMTRVMVESCPLDSSPCSPCQVGTSCYGQGMPMTGSSLDVGDHSAYVGGVRSIDTILNKTNVQVGSHDFVGCIRSFLINGQDKLQGTPMASEGVVRECPRTSPTPVCDSFTCENGGTCVSEWASAKCLCTAKYYGQHCEKELHPFGFGPETRVSIAPKESARRDAIIAEANNGIRRRRATESSRVLVRFRTTAQNGVLLFTSTFGKNRYSVLSVLNGKLQFTVKQYGASKSTVIEDVTVADGQWHNATVVVSDVGYIVLLNNQHQRSSTDSAFKFTSLDTQQMSLGGAPFALSIDNQSMKDFDGCISVFELDGKPLPMNGTTDFYTLTPVGGVENGCSAMCTVNPCDGGVCTVSGEAYVCAAKGDDSVLSIGIIVVIVFFIILIIVIIIVFIVFRRRKISCMKSKLHTKQNGTTAAAALSKSANSSGHSHQDSGYSENNIDELIIRNHIAQELANNQFHPVPGGLMKPDIIKSDIGRTPMPLEIEDGTVIIDNASDLTHLRDFNGEMPEHYDLENASSIAPSDIDVVDHYRHFHNGGKHRRKTKSNHSQNSSSRHQHSAGHHSHHNHHSHGARDSPNLLTSVPYLNDLAMDSPNSRNNHSPINQLSRQSPNVRKSPMTQMNMHGHNMPVTDLNHGSRTTSEHSLASHRSKNSNSTPHKPKRQMLPNGRAPSASKIPNSNYKSDKFLTLEEVDRLNARPRESPASLMEAFSTSSENNTRKMHKPMEHYQDTSVLLEPPESSSDDSANDSFTCSEFEYENDKQRNDFDPDSRIFSNLTEVENENEDGAYHNKNFKSDGLDSGGNSFSSNTGSADERDAKSKAMKNAFNWDDLLNWGPKFEKLVGVFTDIALLPDADAVDLSELEGKMTDREEYV